VLGVSPDGAESHRAFAKGHEIPFPLLSDPDHRTMERYGAWKDKGVRSTVWIGPDGTVRRHWTTVKDAAAHPAEVLEALRSR